MKIYLAGGENHVGKRHPRLYVQNVFVSFFSFYKGSKKGLASVKEHAQSIIVDSGAHSFFSMNKEKITAAGTARRAKVQLDVDEYWNRYVRWLQTNYEFIDYFAELDIGELVGKEKVKSWRQELKEKGLFKKCLTVYHPAVMSWEDFKEMVRENKTDGPGYIALEGIRGKKRAVDYIKCAQYLMKEKVRFHGFAMVRQKYLDLIPFYSVDSSSWLSGVMYGGRTTSKKGRLSIATAGKSWTQEEKLIEAARAYEQIEDVYTRKWQERGVDWKKQEFNLKP
jgi:hypothetical protein